jgi:hypothetical protein
MLVTDHLPQDSFWILLDRANSTENINAVIELLMPDGYQPILEIGPGVVTRHFGILGPPKKYPQVLERQFHLHAAGNEFGHSDDRAGVPAIVGRDLLGVEAVSQFGPGCRGECAGKAIKHEVHRWQRQRPMPIGGEQKGVILPSTVVIHVVLDGGSNPVRDWDLAVG